MVVYKNHLVVGVRVVSASILRDLLVDLGMSCGGPTEMFTDNRGVVELSIDPVSFKKTKHILRAAEFLRDLALRRVVKLTYGSLVCATRPICLPKLVHCLLSGG